MLRFIPKKPALLAGRILVLADLHIGIEHEMFGKGVRVSSPTKSIIDEVISLINEYEPELLVLLGDVKHNIPSMPPEEMSDVRNFFDAVAGKLPVVITPGNHDGNIKRLLGKNGVTVSPSSGAVIDGFGFFHGNAWPSPEVMAQKSIITAHGHPCVEILDPVGGRHVLKAWCIGKLSKNALKRYPNANLCAKVVIAPAFNPLISGAAVNRSPPEGALGPLFSNKIFKLEQSQVYLLDGTPLGKASSLLPKGGEI